MNEIAKELAGIIKIANFKLSSSAGTDNTEILQKNKWRCQIEKSLQGYFC